MQAACKFEIFDIGFLLTGVANCAVGCLFLWISMWLLSKKYPGTKAIEAAKAKELLAAPDAASNNPVGVAVVQGEKVTMKNADTSSALSKDKESHGEVALPLLDGVDDEEEQERKKAEERVADAERCASKYVCDLVVREFCSSLIGLTFADTSLALQPGLELVEMYASEAAHRLARRAEQGLAAIEGTAGTSGANNVPGTTGAAESAGAGGEEAVNFDVDAVRADVLGEPIGRVASDDLTVTDKHATPLRAGLVLRLAFTSAAQLAKVRRTCEGLEPVSQYAAKLGRKRYKRLLYEVAYHPEFVDKSHCVTVREKELFDSLQCAKVGIVKRKNLVLVEAFSHKFEKACAGKKEILLVKPVAGTKPPRSVLEISK